MELWFIYAMISVVLAGLAAFVQKVGVERAYDNMLFNTVGALASTVPAYLLALLYSGVNDWLLAILFGGVSGVLYLLSTFTRTEGMRNIDTALFFPLYKTFGPILVTISGLIFFNEWFTVYELFGIGIGIVVPLLLIHKSEHSRQKNLARGLFFMAATVILTSVTTITSKMGAELLSSVFLFTAIANTIGGIIGFGMVATKQRDKKRKIDIKTPLYDIRFLFLAICVGFLNMASFTMMLLAFRGGSLAIVYTINSFYILIPIILSIIIYKEHWNLRKALAIGLSIVALVFLR